MITFLESVKINNYEIWTSMKTKITLLFLLVLFVANCTNQSDKKADNNKAQIVYVYTSIPYEKASFKLYLDQDSIGEIPFIDSAN